MRKQTSIAGGLRSLLAVTVAIYLILSLVGGVVLMEGALHIARRPVTGRNDFSQSIAPWVQSGVVDAEITAADGARLVGWYAQPTAWNGRSVILLHGSADNRQGMMGYAPMFLRAGYAVLLPDSRGHGESGGSVVTYGLLESGDVDRWSEWIASRSRHADDHAGCTYLFGESMGAAIALQAAASTPNVCAVVAEASYASFREIGYERVAQGLHSSVGISHVIGWPMVNMALLYARLRYGLDFDRVSPERRLAASHVPALLIAGLADRNIPPRHSERIARLSGQRSELWLVPGADHTMAASVDSAEFERRVLGWFSAHSRMPA
jgi:pimeloyl-ACP methyl ester carboxylesterase